MLFRCEIKVFVSQLFLRFLALKQLKLSKSNLFPSRVSREFMVFLTLTDWFLVRVEVTMKVPKNSRVA